MQNYMIEVEFPVHDGTDLRDDSVPRIHSAAFKNRLTSAILAIVGTQCITVHESVDDSPPKVAVGFIAPERPPGHAVEILTVEDGVKREHLEAQMRELLDREIRERNWLT